ncbi:MAG: response regulator, partial [Caldilineaceae bacterium]|nr:response regulator [Caldilineaceae bacterium]
MDIQMPVMDGLEAIRRLRANERTDQIPIIALTGLTFSGDDESCIAAGADLYFSKPFSLKLLSQSITDIVQNGRPKRAR